MIDCDQQHLSQLDYTNCFFNLERIFWQFCKKLAVLGSAFLQMPHTVLYSSAWQPDFGSIIQSNNLSTRKWPLILTVPSCNGFMSLYLWGCVTRPWWHWWCKFIFWNLSWGAASYCTWLTLKFVNCHQQRLYTADGFAKCSHSVAPPICMNRLNVDSADSAVSKTVVCSFL